jgi:hypothetical protein
MSEIVIVTRECKNCKIIQDITKFKKQYNKKLKNPGYSHKCTKCIRLARRPYQVKNYNLNSFMNVTILILYILILYGNLW